MARLTGIAIIDATSVTSKEATTSGKVPNFAFAPVGYQLVPNIKSPILTFCKIGIPSTKRKSMIRNNTTRQDKPIKKNDFSITDSITSDLLFASSKDFKLIFIILF